MSTITKDITLMVAGLLIGSVVNYFFILQGDFKKSLAIFLILLFGGLYGYFIGRSNVNK